MTTSTIKKTTDCNIERVWEAVTAFKECSWRSDLSRTEVIDEKHFVEYTKNGYPTYFTITVNEPYARLEFDLENSNMSGHWIGVFHEKGNQTEVEFTEKIKLKKFFMRPFAVLYLRRQQKLYMKSLVAFLKKI